MSVELEAAGAASVGGLTTRQSADLTGQPCKNCGTVVAERYCTNCGQLAASFHRPILSLIGETIADTFTLDGRLARTVPILLFRPGRLTRNYTEGKRARYVPPFRLFLIASLVFYLVLFTLVPPVRYMHVDDQIRDEITESLSEGRTDEAAEAIRESTRARLRESNIEISTSDEFEDEFEENIQQRIIAVLENQEQFAAQVENWLPRLSILIVPMTMLALAILHFWRRKLYIYTHAIHALHLHSWMYLTGAVVMLTAPYLSGTVIWMYVLAFCVYVWRSLAVVGSTGVIMSGLRFFTLIFFWVFVIVMVIIATIIASGLSVQTIVVDG